MIFVNRLSPYVVSVPIGGHPVGIRWYGLAYVFGFILAYLVLRRAARLGRVPGLTPEALEGLVTAIVIGVMVGGRLGFVLQHPRELLADPVFLVRVWEGGMAFFGGLIGIALALAWASRTYGIPWLALADTLAPPAALALGVGRIANFVNGELVGRPTRGDWGVIFPNVDSLPRHPSQLYEAVAHFLIYGILALAARRWPERARPGTGWLSALFLALYGLFRFATDFYRADETYLGPFSTGQWASLALAVIGLLWLSRIRVPAASQTADGKGPAHRSSL